MFRDERGGPLRQEQGRLGSAETQQETASRFQSITPRGERVNTFAHTPGAFSIYFEETHGARRRRRRARRRIALDYLITAAGMAAIIGLLTLAGMVADRLPTALVVGVAAAVLFACLAILTRIR